MILCVLGLIVLLAIGDGIFYGVFYVTEIDVVGNTLFTDKEIIRMCEEDLASNNSRIICRWHSDIEPEEDFVDNITVEYINRNKIRLSVNENTPVGYFLVKGNRYYVDKKGYVLSMTVDVAEVDDSENTATQATVQSGSDAVENTDSQTQSSMADITSDQIKNDTQDAQTQKGDQAETTNADGQMQNDNQTEAASDQLQNAGQTGSGNAGSTDRQTTSGSAVESGQAREAVSENTAEESQSSSVSALSSAAEKTEETGKASNSNDLYEAAIENLPEIQGIDTDGIAVGVTVGEENTKIFQTILSLDKMLDKQQLYPEVVETDESATLTLYFGSIKVMLGKDTLLEDKVSRVAAILPQLTGESGTLHLENFDSTTKNIIFQSDGSTTATENQDTAAEGENASDGENSGDGSDAEVSYEEDGEDDTEGYASYDEESYDEYY